MKQKLLIIEFLLTDEHWHFNEVNEVFYSNGYEFHITEKDLYSLQAIANQL